MRYYPIFLDIVGRECLVVGGGEVGTRKVERLLECGARVTVISPQVTARLAELAQQGRIVLKQRPYRDADSRQCFLMIGATDNSALNRKLHAAAANNHRLCNIADQPQLCNFVVPSVVHQGALSIAVSTSGKSPAFAKYLRRHLKGIYGPEYASFLNLMGAIREKLLALNHDPKGHKPLFEKLIGSRLPEMIKQDDREGINALLNQVLGPDYRYEDLLEMS